MPAIQSLVARNAISQISKRETWAQQESGVIVVFCIVFLVVVLLDILRVRCRRFVSVVRNILILRSLR